MVNDFPVWCNGPSSDEATICARKRAEMERQTQRMAQKVQIIKTDDLENSDVPAAETITFALDGTTYEIDLSEENATELRDAFARYVGAARKVTRGGGGRASGAGRSRPRRTARREGPRRRSRHNLPPR